MAILVGYFHRETFEYWHEGTGSQIFFLTATLLFGAFCYFISRHRDVETQDSRSYLDREPLETATSSSTDTIIC